MRTRRRYLFTLKDAGRVSGSRASSACCQWARVITQRIPVCASSVLARELCVITLDRGHHLSLYVCPYVSVCVAIGPTCTSGEKRRAGGKGDEEKEEGSDRGITDGEEVRWKRKMGRNEARLCSPHDHPPPPTVFRDPRRLFSFLPLFVTPSTLPHYH